MPNLNEIIKERDNKKFIKKNYRPWDLSGDSSLIPNNAPQNESLTNLHKYSETSQVVVLCNEEEITQNFTTNPEIDNTLDNNKTTNKYQQDNKQATNKYHLDINKGTYKETKEEQLDINLDPTSIYHQLMKLAGIQKNILSFIVDLCTIRNGLETGPIETLTLSLYTKANIGVVKISIKRLIDKGFVIRNKGKQAKGGYINLSITSEVYNAVREQKENKHHVVNPQDLINSIRYQLDINNSYNSSSYNKTITTNKIETLPDEWSGIDFEPLKPIGFTKTQIKQLIEKNDPALVQESINHFAFGIENNPKVQKYEDPLNVLMGVLRKGQGWLEKDYRSPKEIAQQQLLAIKKTVLEREQKFEEDAYKLALNEWQKALSSDEIEKIAPDMRKKGDPTPQSAKLGLYFKDKIWPTKKTEYLISE